MNYASSCCTVGWAKISNLFEKIRSLPCNSVQKMTKKEGNKLTVAKIYHAMGNKLIEFLWGVMLLLAEFTE